MYRLERVISLSVYLMVYAKLWRWSMTGRALIAWREQFGYSQVELAKALRLDTGVIVNWEKQIGNKLPPFLQMRLRALEDKPPASDTGP